MPVYYEDFDKDYDRNTEGHNYRVKWDMFSSIFRERGDEDQWMNTIISLLPQVAAATLESTKTTTTGSSKLFNDEATGQDHLGIELAAEVLAEFLAYKSLLEPPFVLGILGKWGSGKSFFHNKMLKRINEIQKMDLTDEDNFQFAGHMYVINFNAWTYGKSDLWASFIFRIFKDLSDQLSLEEKIAEKFDLKVGGLSMIELLKNLSTSEQNRLKTDGGIDIEIMKEIRETLLTTKGGDRVSASFSNIFAEQMKKDARDLRDAERQIEKCAKTTICKTLLTNSGGGRKQASNMLLEAVLKKIEIANYDLKEEMMQRTLEENFRDHLSYLEKILVYVKSAPISSIFLIALLIAVFYGVVILWREFGDAILKWLVGIIPSSFLVVFTAVLKWSRHVTAQTKEFTAEFSDNVNKLKVQGAVSDIETAFTNEATTEIQKEFKKISEIKKRLTILEGESMHDVVIDRVESDVYLNKLGLLHQVKEDLDRLSESMNNKYEQELQNRKRHSDIKQIEKNDETTRRELKPFIDSQPHLQIDLQKSKKDDSNRFPVVTYGDFTFWALHYTSTTPARCGIGPRRLLKGKQSTKNGWLVVGINRDKEVKILKNWDDKPNESTTLRGIIMEKGLKRCIFTFSVRSNKNKREIEREIDFDYLIDTKEGYRQLLRGNYPKVEVMDDEGTTLLKSTKGTSKRDMFPRGKPRIIIFIDDLDRTDPDKILDVLEAMQLLVSTPLFVIVAAIDSRYVCLSLEYKDQYDKILRSHQSPTGMDFLEKIFQASYRLPTITEDKMKDLLLSQVVIKDEEISSRSDVQEQGNLGNDNETPVTQLKPDRDIMIPQEQTFTSQEFGMLNDACKSFKLLPRTVKRLVNVFKIMKLIWHRQGERGVKLSEDLKKYSLLFLVMAASDKTRDGMQVIFSLMEELEVPTSGKEDTFLSSLIKEHCPVLDDQGNAGLLKGLGGDEFLIDSREKWAEISEKFCLARSFSFYRSVRVQKKNN